jgi:hypothetical protein
MSFNESQNNFFVEWRHLAYVPNTQETPSLLANKRSHNHDESIELKYNAGKT